MKATVVGATVPAKTLRAALVKADVPTKDVRTIGPRAWVELPADARDALLARLADALATGLMVIDVDLPVIGGEGLQASRATYRGVEADISEEARKLLDERIAATSSKPLDAAGAASDLAWALVGDADDAASPAEPNVEEQWATTLIGKLVGDGLIELRGTHTPITQLALVLQTPGRDLGERLLASLIDSTAIDEVYADADQLATLARATRPKR